MGNRTFKIANNTNNDITVKCQNSSKRLKDMHIFTSNCEETMIILKKNTTSENLSYDNRKPLEVTINGKYNEYKTNIENIEGDITLNVYDGGNRFIVTHDNKLKDLLKIIDIIINNNTQSTINIKINSLNERISFGESINLECMKTFKMENIAMFVDTLFVEIKDLSGKVIVKKNVKLDGNKLIIDIYRINAIFFALFDAKTHNSFENFVNMINNYSTSHTSTHIHNSK